jgi:aryl-alcohol dehydrogenase-like predicted oxidoreductase
MEYVKLKNTDISVSRICMGGCPMGGYGWGFVSENAVIATVHRAIDSGINFFDTADTYGLGQSERTLAKALEGKRSEIIIATKFGVRAEKGKTFYDNSPEYIEKALHSSLKRLSTDYIDLYQIHYRNKETPLDAVVEVLERFKEQGKIRCYGLSNIHHEDFEEIKPFVGNFASCQNEYSLVTRTNENELLVDCKNLRLTPMSWGSLGQGVLTGKYNADSAFGVNDRRSRDVYTNFHGEKLKRNICLYHSLRPLKSVRLPLLQKFAASMKKRKQKRRYRNRKKKIKRRPSGKRHGISSKPC